jgi:glyoxylate reductase
LINKPTVLITRKIPTNGIEILRSRYNVIINKRNRPLNRKELIENVKDIDAIFCVLQDRFDEQIMYIAGPNLKVISTFSTGYEHIDIESANKKGIRVCHIGNTLTETTADLAFGLIVC